MDMGSATPVTLVEPVGTFLLLAIPGCAPTLDL